MAPVILHNFSPPDQSPTSGSFQPSDHLQAASNQCALVGGDTPTLREIWGKSMTYVNPDDVRELAKACNGLLENPTESRHNGEEAYQCAKNTLYAK